MPHEPDWSARVLVLILTDPRGQFSRDTLVARPASQVVEVQKLLARRPIDNIDRLFDAAVDQPAQDADVEKAVALNPREYENQALIKSLRFESANQSSETKPPERRDEKCEPTTQATPQPRPARGRRVSGEVWLGWRVAHSGSGCVLRDAAGWIAGSCLCS